MPAASKCASVSGCMGNANSCLLMLLQAVHGPGKAIVFQVEMLGPEVRALSRAKAVSHGRTSPPKIAGSISETGRMVAFMKRWIVDA